MAESVMEVVRRYQIDPKKSLGQNFLIDASHLDRIVAAAELDRDDVVLEIGSGLGTLTRRLAAQAGQVVTVELDDRLIELLRADFAGQPHVHIVHNDILAIDPLALLAEFLPPAFAKNAGYKVVANLPYYITSLALRHILEASPPPTLAVVMVQKEVAERICAKPGDLSLLAISVQFYANPRIIQRVSAGAFYPTPKVDSAILRLDVLPQPAVTTVAPREFFTIVRAGFGQKRKQLANSLSAGLAVSKVVVQEALTDVGIDPKRRAETLTLAEWGVLCPQLEQARTR